MLQTAMTNDEALSILVAVKAKLGRQYKSAIRVAWMNGDYDGEGLGEWSSRLQQIRNTFGPSWLVRAKVHPQNHNEYVQFSSLTHTSDYV